MSHTYTVQCFNDYTLVIRSYEFGYLQHHRDDTTWAFRSWEEDLYETLPVLSNEITEGEVFQLSLIWDYKIPLEHYIKIRRMYDNNEITESEDILILG